MNFRTREWPLYRVLSFQVDDDAIMQVISGVPIATVVQQHAEESVILRSMRSGLAFAPHVKLHHLRRLDDRIAAHLDGLAVAGEFGLKLCNAALESPRVGEVFTAAVRAIEDKNPLGLEKILAIAETVSESQAGLLSAFGWVSMQSLQDIVNNLLASSSAFRYQAGIAACAMQQVDPGTVLGASIADANPILRARGLRVAGEIGRRDLLQACISALGRVLKPRKIDHLHVGIDERVEF